MAEAKHGTGETQGSIIVRETSSGSQIVSQFSDEMGADTSSGAGPDSEQARRQEPSLSPQRKRKWYSLMDKVYAPANLQQAWGRIKANGGAAGIDGVTIARYAEGVDVHLPALGRDLKDKTYRPEAARRVYIQKDSGGRRPLGIPTVRDRIVQQALLQVLSPIFEAKFSNASHGFRPERGCATALAVVDRAVRHGYEWIVDADIAAFFDTVDHAKLIAALNEEIADGRVLNLITRILQAGVIEPNVGEMEPTRLGTPQGGPLSPLLANVYLHHFDMRVKQAGYGAVRYADDFVIFARSEAQANAALQLVYEVLEGELGLQVHPEKTRVVHIDTGFDFLGFRYYRDAKSNQLRKVVRRKSMLRFREAVRQRTPRMRNQRKPKASKFNPERLANNQRLKEMIGDLNRFLRGWHWYFKGIWLRHRYPFTDYDQFVRRRLRSALVGRTGNGWWSAQITNHRLQRLGLLSLNGLQAQYRQGQLDAPIRKDLLDGKPYAGNPHVRFGKAGSG